MAEAIELPHLISIVIPAFNAAGSLELTLGAVAQLHLPPGWLIEVVVSDDGSTDNTVEFVEQLGVPFPLRVVRGEVNRGRAAARNRGVAESDGEYVLFLDADCVLTSRDALDGAVAKIESGCDAVVGVVTGRRGGFWGRLNLELMRERIARSDVFYMTSAVLLIKKSLLLRVGGFYPGYKSYGFEDRDLFACLLADSVAAARISIDTALAVDHDDEPTLRSLCEKQYLAGRYSAPIFMERHSNFYRKLPYFRVDSSFYPPAVVASAVKCFCRPVVSLTPVWERLLNSSMLPFRLRRQIVRCYQAAAFFLGSSERASTD